MYKPASQQIPTSSGQVSKKVKENFGGVRTDLNFKPIENSE